MRHKPNAPEINVTPLVDVVLVLLIIFMVVVPQLNSGAVVDPPIADHVDPKNSMKHEPIKVSITRAGDVYIERTPVRQGDVRAALVAVHRSNPNRPVQIRGDRGVSYGEVREVFQHAQKVGFHGVGLTANERKTAKQEQ